LLRFLSGGERPGKRSAAAFAAGSVKGIKSAIKADNFYYFFLACYRQGHYILPADKGDRA